MKLLSALNPRQIHKLADAFEEVVFEPKTNIVTQGDVGDAFYILQEGEVDIWISQNKKRKFLYTLEAGSFFGEKALLTNELRSADCIAKTTSVCLRLDRTTFDLTLGPLARIQEKHAKAFSSMYRDWEEIHFPLVNIWMKEKQRELKDRQQEYMHAEKEQKPFLLSFIDPTTQNIKEVKQELKSLEKIMKGREDTEGARKLIKRILTLIDGRYVIQVKPSNNIIPSGT